MSEVIAIYRAEKKVEIKNIVTGETYFEHYDKLVLSPGADPVRPPLPGIQEEGIFTLRNVTDTDKIKTYVQQFPKGKAVVIGAGFIGLEMAENLHHLGMQVSIIEMINQVMAPADFTMASIVQQHIRSKGVDLRLNTAVAGFERRDGKLNVLLKDGNSIATDVVILSIGVRQDTKLAAEAGLQIGQARGIVVNEYLQTSDDDIYAVGDAIEFKHPISGNMLTTYLAGPANKQGRICADNIVMGNVEKYKGSIGTAIVKVFDLTVAVSGMAAKHLKAANIDHIVSTTHSGSHAGYYPDAEQMSIQLAFSPGEGKVLGAQIVGKTGVDKRIDILSSVIQRGSDIHELTEFEHAYAPPYSSAKDPVNMAGFVAENILDGKHKIIYWDKIQDLSENDLLIDVRSAQEFGKGSIPGAINISVDDIRTKLDELPKDKNIYVFCQIGLRGYLAQRILLQHGFDKVYNLSGGYKLWENAYKETMLVG